MRNKIKHWQKVQDREISDTRPEGVGDFPLLPVLDSICPDIEKFLPVAIFKMATTIPHKFNIVRFQLNFICRYIMMSRIDSWQIQHCSISTSWIDSRHWKISTGLHFQNERHNTAKIQHCSISKVAFNLFFKPVVSGRFGRLHNR